MTPKDPVVFNFCSEIDLRKAIEKAERKIVRERKKAEKEKKILRLATANQKNEI